MAKDKLTDYDSLASGNLDVGGVSVAEGMLPSGVNNAIRELMSHQADAFGAGTPLYVDQTNNRVGIGTTSPIYALQVGDSASTTQASFALASTTAGTCNIRFGDGTSGTTASRGRIEYDHSDDSLAFWTVSAERMRIDSSGNVGIGTSSPARGLHLNNNGESFFRITSSDTGNAGIEFGDQSDGVQGAIFQNSTDNSLRFNGYNNSERMRINAGGSVLVNKTISSLPTVGHEFFSNGAAYHTRDSSNVLYINRLTNDGALVVFYQDTSSEGNISVSGTLVSYNGGHLARWSQLADGTKDETIVKGTVLTNLDQMAVWHHEAVAAQDAVLDEEGNVVTEAVEAKDAYTEDNEQLNCMAVSSVEGDPNVAGVFINWDNDDDQFNDMNIAMTGDAIIRIASGTTVARGDLLMSAGDGTAKPQGDDIVRSKTIAKVTSTHVSHTYDDGSYLVPCVLMAC